MQKHLLEMNILRDSIFNFIQAFASRLKMRIEFKGQKVIFLRCKIKSFPTNVQIHSLSDLRCARGIIFRVSSPCCNSLFYPTVSSLGNWCHVSCRVLWKKKGTFEIRHKNIVQAICEAAVTVFMPSKAELVPYNIRLKSAIWKLGLLKIIGVLHYYKIKKWYSTSSALRFRLMMCLLC